jgi:hypothetical protein
LVDLVDIHLQMASQAMSFSQAYIHGLVMVVALSPFSEVRTAQFHLYACPCTRSFRRLQMRRNGSERRPFQTQSIVDMTNSRSMLDQRADACTDTLMEVVLLFATKQLAHFHASHMAIVLPEFLCISYKMQQGFPYSTWYRSYQKIPNIWIRPDVMTHHSCSPHFIMEHGFGEHDRNHGPQVARDQERFELKLSGIFAASSLKKAHATWEEICIRECDVELLMMQYDLNRSMAIQRLMDARGNVDRACNVCGGDPIIMIGTTPQFLSQRQPRGSFWKLVRQLRSESLPSRMYWKLARKLMHDSIDLRRTKAQIQHWTKLLREPLG